MKILNTSFGLLLIIALVSCQKRFPYETGSFPEDSPINLAELNSEYDDMNSDYNPPQNILNLNFIFSSNASSRGNDFDLEARSLNFIWDKELGEFSYSIENYPGANQDITNRLLEINSECDEKGPYSFRNDNFFFTRKCDEVYHIYGSEFENLGSFEGIKAEIHQLKLLDNESNEMYPSFYGDDFLKIAGVETQGKPEKMLFTSDKDGTFDLYEMDLPSNMTPMEFLIDAKEKNIQKLSINSSANDHMPFVYGDMLVFSSDRPGGLGGFDLYYSLKTSEGWTEPENFGSKVNSEYDEYRPVVSSHYNFSNRVMIYTSNRPGGLGGFDLYFVGIPEY